MVKIRFKGILFFYIFTTGYLVTLYQLKLALDCLKNGSKWHLNEFPRLLQYVWFWCRRLVFYLVQNIPIFEKSDEGTFGVKFGFWYEKIFVPIFYI